MKSGFLLSRRSDLDHHLSSLQSSSTVLDIIFSNTSSVLSNVSSTSDLADRVSAKVRELDLAQSRVNTMLLRLDAIVERTNCINGVTSALDSQDYESAASSRSSPSTLTLRLMHECTATALSYGIYKTDFSNSGLNYVAFVGIGHCDTQVSIASFESGHMTMRSHTFDRSLGGRDFDEVLFTHFAPQFKEQYKIDVYSNIKACVRLRATCEMLKKVLSANAEAPLNIECLMDEKDVKGCMKREEFEMLASNLLERIRVLYVVVD